VWGSAGLFQRSKLQAYPAFPGRESGSTYIASSSPNWIYVLVSYKEKLNVAKGELGSEKAGKMG